MRSTASVIDWDLSVQDTDRGTSRPAAGPNETEPCGNSSGGPLQLRLLRVREMPRSGGVEVGAPLAGLDNPHHHCFTAPLN